MNLVLAPSESLRRGWPTGVVACQSGLSDIPLIGLGAIESGFSDHVPGA